MDGARDGTPVSRDESARGAQYRRIQRPGIGGAVQGRGGNPARADRVRSGYRAADVRGPAASAGGDAADRRGGGRNGGPDDGGGEGDRGSGAAPGADGARGGHP